MQRQDKNQRADKVVRARHQGLSGSQIEEAFETGLILSTDGKMVRKGDKVAELDFARLESHLGRLREGNPSLKIPVVHEGDGFVVIDKPAGIPSHPLHLADAGTVTHWAFAHYPKTRDAFPGPQPTLVPHRLDTGTSGVLIVCLNSAAFRIWRDHFEKKRVRKTYLAWCWGRPPTGTFEINYALAHDPVDTRKMSVPTLGQRYVEPLLEAQSVVRILGRRDSPRVFLAEVLCHTGVTHQVRVHLASVGFPLVGDSLYDAQFTSRMLMPNSHRLRAVKVETPEGSFEVTKEGFDL